MGGRGSKEDGRRSFRSADSFRSGGYAEEQYSMPRYGGDVSGYQEYLTSTTSYGAPQATGYSQPYSAPQASATRQTRKLDRRYSKISDNYNSLEEVTEALGRAGLESSNLIVGIDFTKSNEWTGRFSFHNRSLHHLGDVPNPYEHALSIIGQTLSAFDEDNLIPCFGFGDASTHDQDVFSFFSDERSCVGFTEALSRYREIVPHLRLAGPTSFAPIIEMAMTIVAQSGGQYHVLLIIADGQVTRSVDTQSGHLSSQEQRTVDAIVKASEFPLSIILVGVGDGPWDMMREFDDNIPDRSFDNFQFVNFTEIMSKNTHQKRKETEFALAALMEIPTQYKATIELGILGNSARSPQRFALPPPNGTHSAAAFGSKSFQSTTFQKSSSSYPAFDSPTSSAPFASSASSDNHVCPICLTNPKNLAFGCGHQTCYDCGQTLVNCPICRSEIVTRIRLY
ncbi:E3 ubiquitin-protein ligase RGLG2-like [Phalaenopsis equestris]|uniref:E3 ubiquitin-protein ligase RGLG2-like n=1 Tax=Phalaenopsis equestris TaxID=78828 RepID=UPI0009E2E806|nr:E3 ubiquitin-protein ligase RGLG2-like [Phalaenopsis equestris]